MTNLKSLFGLGRKPPESEPATAPLDAPPVMASEQEENREHDLSILADEDGSKEQRQQQLATKEVQAAAETSLKKLHVLRLGRCPECGEHVRRHPFATVCEACGWHTFEVPKAGGVVVHLARSEREVKGDCCYFVRNGDLLVIKDDMVVAKLVRHAVGWIDYLWSEGDVIQQRRQLVDRTRLSCGWCNGPANPEASGFHLVHVAFGSTQERYCFCSDGCFEAFRKMYPARVHRNCYERDCEECNLCTKRYTDGSEGMHLLAKDFLPAKKQAGPGEGK